MNGQKISNSQTDQSMLGLFRTEVENHASTLNEGLLKLESNPNEKDTLESVLRAAHSIKGAARIVQIHAAVSLAHALEDCFISAQEKQISLSSRSIDLFLRGVSMLKEIAESTLHDHEQWFEQHQSTIDEIISSLDSLKEPISQKEEESNTQDVSDFLEKEKIPTETIEETPQEENQGTDRFVRVTEEKLNRLMALTGEAHVETRRLRPLSKSLFKLRRLHSELANNMEHIREELDRSYLSEHARNHFQEIQQKLHEFRLQFNILYNDFESYARRTANLSNRLYHEIIASKMRPFSDGIQGFPLMIRNLAQQLKKQVKFKIHGKSTQVDRDILEKLESPITHLLRNAVDHGIEPPEERIDHGKKPEGCIVLEACHSSGMLSIQVSDDGRGIDLNQLKQSIIQKELASNSLLEKLSENELFDFLFLPGFTTTDAVTHLSGRGFGLDVVHTMVHEVGGVIRIHSTPGQGTTFHLLLPLTLSILRSLLFEVSGESYALSLSRIDHLLLHPKRNLQEEKDHHFITVQGQKIGVVPIHRLLELAPSSTESDFLSVLLISNRTHRFGLIVDRFVGERNLIVRPLDARLGKIPDLYAVSLLNDGSPVLILDIDDILCSTEKFFSNREDSLSGECFQENTLEKKKKILIADDSLTVREVQRQILEKCGYEVELAVDGAEAWNILRDHSFHLIITDIDMPRMDGLELTQRLKSDERFRSIPVMVLSYKDRRQDRKRSQEAGANYYLPKSSFYDDTLISAVNHLLWKEQS